MTTRPLVLFNRPPVTRPRVSLVLLDWSCRESFHIFDYLAAQDVPREWFEVVWIEYYDRAAPEIGARIEAAMARREAPPVDRWIVMHMPREAYYHKHLMYNAGVLASRGELVMIGDSDAMVRPTFVRSLCDAFVRDPRIVLHLDEVRNASRRFYPFNAPSFDEVIGEGCINWTGESTTGLAEQVDPLHVRNYGACFVASREDVIAIGGADEHIDYLGHICGPYDLTWRLTNFARQEIWHDREFLYHTWHPGSDGDANYLGPHDGRNVSTLALETRRTRRVTPLVENPVIRHVRERGALPSGSLEEVLRQAVGDRPLTDWAIDDRKRDISAGRAAWSARRHAEAVALWEPHREGCANDARFLTDLAWSYYFMRRTEDATRTFEEALALNADNPDAHRGLGWTLAVQGAHDQALRHYDRAIALANPVDRLPLCEAYRGRAWTHFHTSRLADAAEDFERALTLVRPADRGAVQEIERGLGWVRVQQQDARASEHFARAVTALGDRRGPEYDDATNGLAQAARLSEPSTRRDSAAVIARRG